MSGPENTFIAAVHKHLPPMEQLYRMKNNNMYNGGIADCWYSSKFDLWIEWKFIVVPKRPDTMIDLHAGKKPSMSALQREWLAERAREGRNVWVGIGSKDGGFILRLRAKWESPFPAAWAIAHMRTRKDLANEIRDFVEGR